MMRIRPLLVTLSAGVLLAAGAVSPSAAATAAADAIQPAAAAVTGPQPGKWQQYVDSPASRTIKPTAVVHALARSGSITGPATNALAVDGKSVRLTSTGNRTGSPLLTVDLGQDVGGLANVRILAASNPRPALHACFSESLAYLALTGSENNGEGNVAPGCDTANIFNGFPGVGYTYDSDSHQLDIPATLPGTATDKVLRGGFRYLTLFLDGPGWVDVDGVTVTFTAAPAQTDLRNYAGHFLSSDDTVNKIWYAGAYTTQLDTGAANTAKSWPYVDGEADSSNAVVPGADPTKEVIYDGGKRDRIVWQGDLAVEGPVTYLSTGDKDAVENSLASLASQQLADGYVPAESLVGGHNTGEERTYGEYVTWFVNNMQQNWMYTGDKAFLTKWWPAVQKAMAWLESVRQQDPQGLISFGAANSCGHYGYTDCGHETYINALYVRNLQQAASLAKVMGDNSSATTYATTARTVSAAINAQLWDPAAGAYRYSRETPDSYPQDANATAVLTGVATGTRATSALAYLRAHNWSTLGSLTVPVATAPASLPAFYAPLSSGFEVDARLAQGGSDPLVGQSGEQLVKNFWGWMLQQDPGTTFWEHVEPNGTPNLSQFSSLAHGWASSPTVSLTQSVLGLTPASGGYATWTARPTPGSLSWAEGTVPTPHGDLVASWQHSRSGFSLQLTAPKGTSGSVQVPTFGDTVKVTVDGRTVWDGKHGSASLQNGYVIVNHVGAGKHTVVATPTSAVRTTVSLAASADTTSVAPGSTVHLTTTLTGRASGNLTGSLTVTGPTGWVVSPATTRISAASDGRVISRTVDIYAYVSPQAASGTPSLKVSFAGSGASASTSVPFSLQRTTVLYDFESGTQGWVAGSNVTSVAAVGSFANGPGRPEQGSGALEATGTGTAADAPRTISVTPSTPLNLSGATTLAVAMDAYGGAPGATGYSGTIVVTATDGTTAQITAPINPDSWTTLTVDLSGFAGRDSVTSISASMHAVGSSQTWQPRFQIDDVRTIT
ncbi:alpha-L-rhamnosidase [Nakamurella panacisegetis]|uniref:Alpha-L-rhamnosidase n=1 Tax=Nakamurella panacisegetis TaxID=1090615 RepID=A0A1H0LRL4_9ACTN|nr:alpha-L-rhamnosidase C-terminal domain-containing protein [Nakamurella panacisegetis]SDO70838.1 alpha-L-rhamnosidase [Nakamurella panacisegetis]